MDSMQPRQRNESEPLRYENNIEIQQNVCRNPLFSSREEMKHSLSRLCYGNCYIIGSIWIEAMKSVLTGSKMCLVPPIEAAEKTKPKDKPKPKPKKKKKAGDPPDKPDKVGYQQLSMYGNEHSQYKEHEDNKYRCPDRHKKILQPKIKPVITTARTNLDKLFRDIKKAAGDLYSDVKNKLKNQKNAITRVTRDPKYEKERKAFVGGSTLLATYLGYSYKGRRIINRGVLWGSLTYLFTGWLCFPRETDQNFRKISHRIASSISQFYTYFCGLQGPTLDYGPCEKERPPLPKDRTKEQQKLCPPPKKPKPKKEIPKKEPKKDPKKEKKRDTGPPPPLYGAHKCPWDKEPEREGAPAAPETPVEEPRVEEPPVDEPRVEKPHETVPLAEKPRKGKRFRWRRRKLSSEDEKFASTSASSASSASSSSSASSKSDEDPDEKIPCAHKQKKSNEEATE